MAFDPNDFLGTSFDQPLDTKRTPTPVGEYIAQIGLGDKDLEIAQGEKDGKPWARLDMRLYLTDPSGVIKQATGSDKPMVFYGIMLDLDENGRFDASKGKNIRVGKVLEAAGKLKPGWKLSDLKGCTFKVKIGHRQHNGETYDDVQAVSAP